MAQLTDQLPLPNAEYLLMTDRSWRTLAAGRLDDAEQLIAAMRDRVERIGSPGGTIVAGAIELALRRYQGRVEEVVDFLNEVADTVLGANRLNLNIARAFMYCELADYARECASCSPKSGRRESACCPSTRAGSARCRCSR